MFAIIGVSIFRDRFGYCDNMYNFNVGINDVFLYILYLNYFYSAQEIEL